MRYERESRDLYPIFGPKRVWRDATFAELELGDIIPNYGKVIEITDVGNKRSLSLGVPESFQMWIGDMDTVVFAFTKESIANSD